MPRVGIALDLGTSGFRGQALDLDQGGRILSTAVTTRHPLPGANVMDHLHFAVDIGLERACEVVVDCVNRVVEHLRVPRDHVVRLAVCGNPIQLSLFQGIEIRDLAYAGKRKLESLGVVAPRRDAQIVRAFEVAGLQLPPNAQVLIPPAVRHEVGADALAMMIKTGMLEKDEIALTTDYGTNAEMALIVGGTVYSGSTAAGPALEGQQIQDGLLALPGAISDVEIEPRTEMNDPVGDAKTEKRLLHSVVLDEEMTPCRGDTVDPDSGRLFSKGEVCARGITGTGVIALISRGLASGIIRLPRINTSDGRVYLPNGVRFHTRDLLEAGKAIGAIRAGHIALCEEAHIRLDEIQTAYMSGASGTYVDALKAKEIGMIPPGVRKIYQVGNTSLAMARDMARDVENLWRMKRIADDLRQHHCMFAESKVFEKVYVLELSFWTEGMPFEQYQQFLRKFGLPPMREAAGKPEVIRVVERDIPDLGMMGMKIISQVGTKKHCSFEGCIRCAQCVDECPQDALLLAENPDRCDIIIDLARCDGVACRRCESVCGEEVFNWPALVTAGAWTSLDDHGRGDGQEASG